MSLQLTLVDAKGLRDTDFLTKSDPYVVIDYQGGSKKTAVCRSGGEKPEWHQTFDFPIDPTRSAEVKLTIRDADLLKDDLVGEVSFSIDTIPKGTFQTLPISRQGKSHGSIRVIVSVTPPDVTVADVHSEVGVPSHYQEQRRSRRPAVSPRRGRPAPP